MNFIKNIFFIAVIIFFSCNAHPDKMPSPVMLDRDNDGVLDSLDQCPGLPGPAGFYGCPVTDSDGDSIQGKKAINSSKTNTVSKPIKSTHPEITIPTRPTIVPRPTMPVPTRPVIIPHLPPMHDSDRDGVPDATDQCPTRRGPASNKGCPILIMPKAIINPDRDGDGSTDNTTRDTAQAASPPNNSVRTLVPDASIAYSYFKKIKLQETKDIRVFLKVNSDAIFVRQRLNTIEEEQQADDINRNDTNVIKTLTIKGYKSVTVSLQYDKADFEVTPVNTVERQDIDSADGNSWYWRVKAISEKQTSEILIEVVAKNPGSGEVKQDSRKIPVKIMIDNISGLRKAWNWVLNNPQYSIPSMLVPFIIYLFGRRKKKEGEKGKDV